MIQFLLPAYVLPSLSLLALPLAACLYFGWRRRERSLLLWREQRSHAQAHGHAETIRDGMLQDVFTLRRQLELAQLDSDGAVQQLEQSLLTVEQLYSDLEQLSSELSSPFLEDSLCLAIQHQAQLYQTNHPSLTCHLDIESLTGNLCDSIDKPGEALSPIRASQINQEVQPRLAITALSDCLQVMLPASSDPHRLSLKLKHLKHYTELAVEVTYAASDTVSKQSIASELELFTRYVNLLGNGHCQQYRCTDTLVWLYRWGRRMSLLPKLAQTFSRRVPYSP